MARREVDDEALRRLGQLIKNRRDEQRLHATDVARHVGWTSQFYGEVERGHKSSGDIEKWLRLADFLQLGSNLVLEHLWDARKHIELSLPPKGDARRATLVELAVELYSPQVEA